MCEMDEVTYSAAVTVAALQRRRRNLVDTLEQLKVGRAGGRACLHAYARTHACACRRAHTCTHMIQLDLWVLGPNWGMIVPN